MEGRQRRRMRRRRRWQRGAGGLVKWMFDVYKETTTPLSFSPRLCLSEVSHRALFRVWSWILRHPVSSYPGTCSGGRPGHNDPIRANCLEIRRLKGQVQINKVFNCLFYHKASFCSVLSVWSRAVREAPELTDTWACEGWEKKKWAC